MKALLGLEAVAETDGPSSQGEAKDFTGDVVQVKIADRWHDMAKVGRQALENPELEPVG